MGEIEKRRKFLLGGEADANTQAGTSKVAGSAKAEMEPSDKQVDGDQEMEEDDLAAEMHREDFVGETITYI